MGGNNAPAMWGFFGVVITTLGGILIAIISNNRRTENVRQEVINSNVSSTEQYDSLARDVKDIKAQLSGHIQWHMERGNNGYVYVRSDTRQPHY